MSRTHRTATAAVWFAMGFTGVASAQAPASSDVDNELLSVGDSYDDFASVAVTRDGTLYAAYAAYYDGHDQIRVHKRLGNGQWSTRSYVPLVATRPDIWMPQLAVDGRDRLWVVWCEQTERAADKTGNWDVFARALEGEQWGPLVRLSRDPKPDINPHVATDTEGNIHVVWQGHADNTGDVMWCRYDGRDWSDPVAVTSGPDSDWYPQVAVDGQGTAWIAFDSYRNGDYDVFLTSVDDGRVGPVIPIATSKYYEAHASVACTPDGRVWVAWERGGYYWGKDQGYWLRIQDRNVGSTLGNARSVHVAAFHQGQVSGAPDVADAVGSRRNEHQALPHLAVGPDGRVWLRFRNRRQHRVRNRSRRYWTENVTHLTANGWAPAIELPNSEGRISVFSRVVAAADGSLHVAYSSDQRGPSNYHQPIRDVVRVTTLSEPDTPVGIPVLGRYEAPAPPSGAREWNAQRENQQVTSIRRHRTDIGDRAHRIVRGDLHRHTEMSWDVGPGNDGSYLDFYRYMIDVAAMDFGSITDHQGGGHYAYWWWLTEKSADMYYLQPRFVPLYGYERSVVFPNGHRNVFHSYRGVPVFPFQLKLDQRGVFPGVGTGAVLDNDTKLLYAFLRDSNGVAISHTSGTRMGTDWRDNDPDVEPVVEIYQGARNSYEVLLGPRVHDPETAPGDAPGQFFPQGMVWNAWAKGYRLGTITSSDHGSTHISYALVYTPSNDRAAILDSIRKRQTYGATDNLIVDFRANGHFMGAEFATGEKITLTLRATGTADVERVDLVRNNEYIFHTEPSRSEIELEYRDMEPQAGTNYYYFRIVQDDGEVAWTSPIWVEYQTR